MASDIARVAVAIELGWPDAEPRTAQGVARWSATLFVETVDGRRLSIGTTGGSSGAFFGSPPGVTRKDVEDRISQALGRDPQERLPLRLWKARIAGLAREGVTVTEDELIAAPIVFEFSDELLAAPDS